MKSKAIIRLVLPFLFAAVFSCNNNNTKTAANAANANPPPAQLSLWINAFIPAQGSGQVIAVTQGPHNGKTAINGPIGVIWCYLTDNRNFSQDQNASHRMQSVVRINLPSLGLTSHTPSCQNTVELKKSDFNINCDRPAGSNGITISAISVTTAGNIKTAHFTLTAEANNPCVTGSPDIDWVIPVIVHLNTTTNKVRVQVINGLVEPFPAFEMYGKVDNLATKPLFTKSPDPGSTPWILPGEPNKVVNADVTLN